MNLSTIFVPRDLGRCPVQRWRMG